MDSKTVQILVAMVIYMAIVIAIGIIFAKRANNSSEDYFLGGRSLGPWVSAMSAEASDIGEPSFIILNISPDSSFLNS